MRILVLGAGAIGGYFGGRLQSAGKDVTFLVRPERARLMAEHGLTIESPAGTVSVPSPVTITADQVNSPYDLILLSCKSYDLESAVDSIRNAIGPRTLILPLLNGMRHLDELDRLLGVERVLGGACFISTKLEAQGRVVHFSDVHTICFGARHADQESRVAEVSGALGGAGFELRASDNIMLEMWEKWIFIASIAGLTCLFRSSLGVVNSSGGTDVVHALYEECRQIAVENGYIPRDHAVQFALGHLTNPESPITASMLGDIERHGPTEGEQIFGDLLRRRKQVPSPDLSVLRMAELHLRCYQRRFVSDQNQ
ncbi:ketopantoate reductase family protein [Planctomicrobium sp. SH527]|uniref:ketopantoate reductase family protein n=1 Tax=Planctomicrobium sp. SH527 TaxID=3448123 RepID=UPI003F5C718C